MMWLLDTNVLSELRPGKPHASPAVRQWAASVPIGRQFISAITLAELETGILRLEHQSPSQGQALRRWYEGIVTLFRERTLVVRHRGSPPLRTSAGTWASPRQRHMDCRNRPGARHDGRHAQYQGFQPPGRPDAGSLGKYLRSFIHSTDEPLWQRPGGVPQCI